jgi:hypothetical protein
MLGNSRSIFRCPQQTFFLLFPCWGADAEKQVSVSFIDTFALGCKPK